MKALVSAISVPLLLWILIKRKYLIYNEFNVSELLIRIHMKFIGSQAMIVFKSQKYFQVLFFIKLSSMLVFAVNTFVTHVSVIP